MLTCTIDDSWDNLIPSMCASWFVSLFSLLWPVSPLLSLCFRDETDEGLLARDYYVISTCLGMGLPVACVVGGGYDSDKGVLATRHSTVFRAAFQAWRDFDDRAKWR